MHLARMQLASRGVTRWAEAGAAQVRRVEWRRQRKRQVETFTRRPQNLNTSPSHLTAQWPHQDKKTYQADIPPDAQLASTLPHESEVTSPQRYSNSSASCAAPLHGHSVTARPHHHRDLRSAEARSSANASSNGARISTSCRAPFELATHQQTGVKYRQSTHISAYAPSVVRSKSI